MNLDRMVHLSIQQMRLIDPLEPPLHRCSRLMGSCILEGQIILIFPFTYHVSYPAQKSHLQMALARK